MKIFVGNLGRDITEEDLRGAFSTFGKLTSVAVLKDKFTGEPRGFGFIEMEAKTEGQAAIASLNGTQLKGRTLTVNEARPKTDRPRGGGGFGGGGGGNRGFGNRSRGGGGPGGDRGGGDRGGGGWGRR
jgi:RNA recognition motif-containing protein